MRSKHIVSIVIALIGAIATISAAIIGVKYGKERISITVQVDGENVTITNTDEVQELATEKEGLQNQVNASEIQIIELESQISELETQIAKLKNENQELSAELKSSADQLAQNPSVEFQSLGLSINGEEKIIEKAKASVKINGAQYYSQDFVNSLLPDSTFVSVNDGTFYVGKIIKEKESLFQRPIIDVDSFVFMHDNILDTYGNIHSKAIYFSYNDHYIVFNTGMEYSRLKCTLSMRAKCRSTGYIQIEADDNVVYTSEEITCQTKPFEIDIPINMASKLTIRSIGRSASDILVSDCILYNEE